MIGLFDIDIGAKITISCVYCYRLTRAEVLPGGLIVNFLISDFIVMTKWLTIS